MGDGVLHFGVYCKSPASQVLLKEPTDREITESHTSDRTYQWLQCCATKGMDLPPLSSDFAPKEREASEELPRLRNDRHMKILYIFEWANPRLNTHISDRDIKKWS